MEEVCLFIFESELKIKAKQRVKRKNRIICLVGSLMFVAFIAIATLALRQYFKNGF